MLVGSLIGLALVSQIANVPLGSKIDIRDGNMTGSGEGLLVQDSGVGSTLLGKGGIKIVRTDIGAQNNGMVVTNSSGIFVRSRFVPPGPHPYNDIGCPEIQPCTVLSLDASSNFNRFLIMGLYGGYRGNVLVSDQGTGNCGDNIHYIGNGTGTLAPCP